jgi:Proteasome subunit
MCLVHSAVLLLAHNLQPQRQAGANRVCAECGGSWSNLTGHQGHQWRGYSNRTEGRRCGFASTPHTRLLLLSIGCSNSKVAAQCLQLHCTDIGVRNLQVPSILVDESTVQKISLLTPNIGVVYSGMGPDSRVLIRKVHNHEWVQQGSPGLPWSAPLQS